MAHHYHEHIKRSLAKAFTFRTVVLISDVIIVYTITHRYDLTLGVLVFSNMASTVIYFFHERFWNHIHWGKTRNDHGKGRK